MTDAVEPPSTDEVEQRDEEPIYSTRWEVCDDCELVTAISVIPGSKMVKGVPDVGEWEELPRCMHCGGSLHFGNADQLAPWQVEDIHFATINKLSRLFDVTAEQLVARERKRQIVKGYTPEHDDAHDWDDFMSAARCYSQADKGSESSKPQMWPWNRKSWKPQSREENLIRAGALYLAAADWAGRHAGEGSAHGLNLRAMNEHRRTLEKLDEALSNARETLRVALGYDTVL